MISEIISKQTTETSVITPRERIRRFLRNQSVDRIPNGLGGCETAGLHVLAYERLKRVLGVDDGPSRFCTFMTNAIFELPVLEALDADFVLLGTRMCPSRFWGPDAMSEWEDLDIWGATLQRARAWQFRRDADGTYWWDNHAKCPPGGFYFDPPPRPAVNGDGIANAHYAPPESFAAPWDLSESTLKRLEEDARWLYENTPFSVVCGEHVFDLQRPYGGAEVWWTRMIEDPDGCHEILDQACEASLNHLRQLDNAVGKYCDILLIADDMGSRHGVTIGTDFWRAIYKPHYKKLFTEWHHITKMKVCLHSCGSVADILDDLIECGVDIINPVQISAVNMDPKTLKQKYGGRIIFYGGAYDAILTPPYTPDDMVYETVRKNIEIFSNGGGYIFAGVHNLPADTPEGHLRAILHAYKDCRGNPALRSKPVKSHKEAIINCAEQSVH